MKDTAENEKRSHISGEIICKTYICQRPCIQNIVKKQKQKPKPQNSQNLIIRKQLYK